MATKEQIERDNWKVAIYEDKHSEKVIAWENHGCNMSDEWWNDTYKLRQNNLLRGVYKTPKGLRRNII